MTKTLFEIQDLPNNNLKNNKYKTMNTKIKITYLAFTFIAILVFTISSCGSKKENAAPVIIIEEPEANDTIIVSDSLHVEGKATDDEGLHELSVLVISSTNDTAFRQDPNVHDLKTYTFHYHFKPSTVGIYTLQVTAADHEEKFSTATSNFVVK